MTISWKKIDPSRYPVRLSIVHPKPVNSWKVASSFLKHPPTLTVVGKGDVLTEEPVEYASPEQPAEPPRLSWSDDKNEQLKQERGISFEQVVHAFAAGRVLADLPHPNQTRYPNQRMLLIDIEGYVYVVPCVPTGEGFFLKTMYPSRQATRRYLHPRRDDLE